MKDSYLDHLPPPTPVLPKFVLCKKTCSELSVAIARLVLFLLDTFLLPCNIAVLVVNFEVDYLYRAVIEV